MCNPRFSFWMLSPPLSLCLPLAKGCGQLFYRLESCFAQPKRYIYVYTRRESESIYIYIWNIKYILVHICICAFSYLIYICLYKGVSGMQLKKFSRNHMRLVYCFSLTFSFFSYSIPIIYIYILSAASLYFLSLYPLLHLLFLHSSLLLITAPIVQRGAAIGDTRSHSYRRAPCTTCLSSQSEWI